jgi:hypothetical protein
MIPRGYHGGFVHKNVAVCFQIGYGLFKSGVYAVAIDQRRKL